ncbi:hypothetical protein M8C21_015587 [Ambrosia artemisiifolia]|uniref:Uncharacterized protein n=1 Tax=Ambrosia artemisiifolia TaxID=4212 RepID=A0AAD5CXH8_AMBAR|nr:hypothetical protein M8C21_015587 [Ambrosia artemisiifolia]
MHWCFGAVESTTSHSSYAATVAVSWFHFRGSTWTGSNEHEDAYVNVCDNFDYWWLYYGEININWTAKWKVLLVKR